MHDSYQDLGKDYLEHYGVLGMKWGVRRFQNKDGSLTASGKLRKKSKRERTPEEIEKSRKRKEVAIRVAKKAAKVGAITAATLLAGGVGSTLVREVIREATAPPPTPKLSNPNGQILTETILRENIITENVIRGQTITEQVLTEKSIPMQVLKETVLRENRI